MRNSISSKYRQKAIRLLVILTFTLTGFNIPLAQAQGVSLPKPGVMVHLSPEYNPPILKGIKVHADNPFKFDFILDKGDSDQNNDQLKQESSKLIKYFLASLTIPEKDLWVNLSPYEKDRIIPNSFGLTEMGRDLLAEDYMLKQITASLIYPEDEIGKRFWKRIYEESTRKYGTTHIPVNTFNKVWIVPEKAVVYENTKAGVAYVVESKLKVMLEQDYLSLERNEGKAQVKETNQLGSQIIREIIIPELTKEINENQNFVQLRQVYSSIILAAWYKKKIKDSILSQIYSDKNKTVGINIDDPQEKEKIYQQYLQAFKKGVYNYIKEEQDPLTQQPIPRKYFSGGVILNVTNVATGNVLEFRQEIPNSAMLVNDRAMLIEAGINVSKTPEQAINSDNSMLAHQITKKLINFLNTVDLIKSLELENGLKALLSEAFGSKVVYYGDLGQSFSFDPRKKGYTSFKIAIPILKEIFTIHFQPKDTEHPKDELKIEVNNQWIIFDEYLPTLQEKINSQTYREIEERAKQDIILRLNVALSAKDEPQAMSLLNEINANPSEENLRGLLNAFMPKDIRDSYKTNRGSGSQNLYIRVVYVISNLLSKFNYQLPGDVRGQCEKLLKWLNTSEMTGMDTIVSNGSFFVGAYAFEHKLTISHKSPNRQKILEYFIFRVPTKTDRDDYMTGGNYEFTIEEVAQALSILPTEAKSIIEELIQEGRVVKLEEGKYETDLLNILNTSELFQTTVNDILSKTYRPEDLDKWLGLLYNLSNIIDLRILDQAYSVRFVDTQDLAIKRNAEHSINSIIHRNIFYFRNKDILKEVIEKYFVKIKSHILSKIQGVKVRNWERSDKTLVLSLAQAKLIDDELAEAFESIINTQNEDLIRETGAKYVLVETGKLIEGKKLLEIAVNELLTINEVENIVDPKLVPKLRKLPNLIESLRIESKAEGMAEAKEIITSLFDLYLSKRKDEIKRVLEILLDGLVKTTKGHLDLYNKMLGSMYKTEAWNRFQSFYRFLKELRFALVTKITDGKPVPLLGSIEGLMRDQGDSRELVPIEQRRVTALDVRGDFSSQYKQAMDKDSQADLLLQKYPMPGMKVDVEVAPVFMGSGHGIAEKLDDNHYKLTLIGVDGEHQGYLLFHEFQHIVLDKRGLTFGWNTKSAKVASYLFQLRNMVQDYLIEKENKKQFGSSYVNITRELRDRELIGQLQGLGTTDPVAIFMLALTSKVTTSLYSELNDSISARFIGEAVHIKEMDKIMAALGRIDINSSPEEFMAVVLEIHSYLTGDGKSSIEEGILKVSKPLTEKFYDETQSFMDQVKGLERSRGKLPRDEAMLGINRKGGIDFNSDKINLEIQNAGEAIKFNVDPAMLKQLQNAPGFYPVIINIQPMTDLRGFLGLNTQETVTVAA